MKNRKITIIIVISLVAVIISLGVAFAVFSTTLNINGGAAVEATSWDIFFTTEADGTKPTQETTVPAANILTSGTAINNYASILATTFSWNASFISPGDKIVYTIYVRNAGNYNAQVSNIYTPAITCTNDSKNACNKLSYGLYTDNNGTTPLTTSFTLDAGETNIIYLIAKLDSSYGGANLEDLVTSNVTINTISATVTFEQVGSAITNNNSGGGNTPSGDPFQNIDGAYYTYEGKSFIGTGVNNVIISENIISKAKYASATGTDNGANANPRYTFDDSPAADAAAAYCTRCRLMTHEEANSWCGADYTTNSKCIAKYSGTNTNWWLADANYTYYAWIVNVNGFITGYGTVNVSLGVRPVVSIPSSATITGSGTSGSPYIITVSN